ncbi:MAG: hypothetical protein JU82_06770 [Sulfuricurvum sp. MLSB]|uniref:DUF996 domain-containing protein n=1 Tax=unclassified Sulfuricurvum TaxID=2632390 RepID=UPI0005003F99|nr:MULTISPECIES: DUF996 domain-containing protein [unclassified Sulfuricurvum]KFN39508.1 MAG: hypothetical protein JU82_06770 [Sulfuricurvum sp. MLSB]
MNGSILNIVEGNGIILGDDEQRYTFEREDVKSSNVRNGTKVNFIVEDNKAKEIYSIAGSNPADTIAQGVANLTGGSDVKTGAYIAAFGAFVALIGAATAFFAFVGLAIELYGVYLLAQYKSQMDFFWYQVKSFVAVVVMSIFLSFTLFGAMAFSLFDSLDSLGFGTIFMAILAFAAALYSVYAMFQSLNRLAGAFDNKLFTIAAWLYLFGILTMFLGVGFVLLLIYSILLIIAYATIKEQ